MKKFGTPIGAAPGSESEKVGLEAFGTPLPVGSLATGGRLPGRFVVRVGVVIVWLCEDRFWALPGLVLLGVVALDVLEVVVELEVEVEVERLVVVDVRDGGFEVVWVVVEPDGVVSGGQDSP